jgi:general secretion pathway protein G
MNDSRERGFTLIELMVVMVILGGLMALVGPSIYRFLFRSRSQLAKTQMALLGETIDLYRMEQRKLPVSMQVLTERDPASGEAYLPRIPKDPWNQDYEYRVITRKQYEIRCLGDDGLANTEDDLTHPVYVDD